MRHPLTHPERDRVERALRAEIERLTADLNILKRHYNLAPNAPLSREEIIAAKDAEIERLRQRIAELEDPHYLNGLYVKIRALGPQP